MTTDFFSKKITKMIKQAYKVSRKSTYPVKIGCVIFDKNIISKSSNEGQKTCPGLGGHVTKLHAEMSAIRQAYYESTQNAYMIIVRGTYENPQLAKPCELCMKQIKDAGIRKIIFSTNGGYEILKINEDS